MEILSRNGHTVIFNQLLYAGMNPGEYFPTASIYTMFFLTFVAIKIAVFLQISTGYVSDDIKMSFYVAVDLQFLQPVLDHGQCHQRFQNRRYVEIYRQFDVQNMATLLVTFLSCVFSLYIRLKKYIFHILSG